MNELFIDKYRPYHLSDFTISDEVKSTLSTLLQIDDLNILFIGPSGSGKTSLLYAMIRDYYGYSNTDIFPESNILFINNLKEQGINYYRNEMKTFCQSQSSIFGKKKMLVIDDIDLINEQSQQVFRNYIDKYKNNIHFICVCSNIQKVIESIQSRVHIVRIASASIESIEKKLNHIIEKENILLEYETKQYLLENSRHSMRVLIHNLEKLRILNSTKPITLETYRQICENISFQHFEEYLDVILRVSSKELDKDIINEALNVIYKIYDYGYSVIDILDYFFSFIKSTNKISDVMKYRIIPFLCKYITVFHNVHEDGIELAFFTNHLVDLFMIEHKTP
jgi:DNA polymerase III delta prime subunit